MTVAQNSDPTTLALVVAWTHLAIIHGVLLADESTVDTVKEAVRVAEVSSSDFALTGAQLALAVALLNADDIAERRRGFDLMVQARDVWLPESAPSLVPLAEVWTAQRPRGAATAMLPLWRCALRSTVSTRRDGSDGRCAPSR